MTREKEKVRNNRRFHQGEMFCACAEDSKWHPAARVCLFRPFMNLVILSWMKKDFNPSLHILDQSERELCGNEVYLLLLHRVSLAGRRKMKEERKKKRKKRKRRKLAKLGFWSNYGATRRERFRGF